MGNSSRWLIAGLMSFVGTTSAEQTRWYSKEQVSEGKPLFQTNCASCHGQEGQGAPNWREPLPDGKLQPPPLNGTGHAWHHPLNVLVRQIQMGGAPLGGSMPAFKEKLSEAQTASAVAYFQSLWPDKVYSAWMQRGGLPASAKSVMTDKSDPAMRYLRARARGRALSDPADTPVSGIKRIKMGGNHLYVTDDGRYVFTGALVDLKTNRNLTQELVEADARAMLDAVPDADKVVFKAVGEQKAVIDVFTDTSCPYCKKLHREVPQLQSAGVTVRYIAYPRGGKRGPGYTGLRQVWCAPDPVKAMDDAKLDRAPAGGAADCQRANLVDQGFDLGGELGIQGTPAIYLPSGKLVSGYVPAAKLLQQLGIR